MIFSPTVIRCKPDKPICNLKTYQYCHRWVVNLIPMVGAIGRVNLTWLESAEFPAEIWLHFPTRKMSLEDTKSSNYPWKLCKINVDTPCLQNPCDVSGAKFPHVCSYSTRFQVMANPLSTLGKSSNGGFPAMLDYRRIFSYFLSMSLPKSLFYSGLPPLAEKWPQSLGSSHQLITQLAGDSQ